jgi:hypothetical protein
MRTHILAALAVVVFLAPIIFEVHYVTAGNSYSSNVWAKSPIVVSNSCSIPALDGVTSRKIVADRFGNLYIAYWNETVVLVAKSTDGGQTWDSSWGIPHEASFLGQDKNTPVDPSIATDSKGNVYVTYNVWDADLRSKALYRMWNATTRAWAQERALNLSPSDLGTAPIVFVDSSDVVHVEWWTSVLSTSGNVTETQWYSKNNGSWTEPVIIAQHKRCRIASMAVGNNGRVCVVFDKVDSGDYPDILQLASSNGSAWHEETIYQSKVGMSHYGRFCIAIDSDNYVHTVAPMAPPNSSDIRVYYIRETANGWTQPINLMPGFEPTIYVDLPRIVVLSSGWNFQVYMCESKDSGNSWSLPQKIIDNPPSGGESPNLAYTGRWVADKKVVDLVWVDAAYGALQGQRVMHATLDVTPTGTASPAPTSTPISSQAPILSPFPTPSTVPFPTFSPSSTQTLLTSAKATTEYGADIDLTIGGNITSSQMSNVTILTDHESTTSLSFALSGQSGTVGFCNVTIPKNAVLYGLTPTIYIDNEIAQDQGFASDFDNYYVWYSTHFSTHDVSIIFASTSLSELQSGTDLPTTSPDQQPSFQETYYVVALAVVIVIIAAVALLLKNRRGNES